MGEVGRMPGRIRTALVAMVKADPSGRVLSTPQISTDHPEAAEAHKQPRPRLPPSRGLNSLVVGYL